MDTVAGIHRPCDSSNGEVIFKEKVALKWTLGFYRALQQVVACGRLKSWPHYPLEFVLQNSSRVYPNILFKVCSNSLDTCITVKAQGRKVSFGAPYF